MLGLSIILLAAAIFYGALFNQFYVGFLNDDALYIVAAKSLLQGHYQTLWNPTHPPLDAPIPGFPFFLMPWVYLIDAPWSSLRLVPILSTLVSGWLLWTLARNWLSSRESLWVTGLFLFNPTTARYSTLIVAEPTFLCFILAVLVLLSREEHIRHPANGVAIGILMGWAALMRPQGILFLMAAAIVFSLKKDWRTIRLSVITAALIWAGVMAMSYWNAHHSNGYVTMLATAPPFKDPTAWILGIWKTLRGFCVGGLWGIPYFRHPFYIYVVSPFIIFATLSLTVRGFVRITRINTPNRHVLQIIGLFVSLYLLLHSLWITLDLRYTFPVLPFMIVLFILGVQGLSRSLRISAAMLLIAISISYVLSDVPTVRQVRSGSGPTLYRRPEATLAWIRSHIPSGSYILTNKAEYFYLETGVYGSSLPEFNADSDLYPWLRQNQITHAVLVHQGLINGHRLELWRRAEDILTHTPAHYRPVYEDGFETTIYAIR